MIKKTFIYWLAIALILPAFAAAQTQPEDEYPRDMLAALDSLTVLLNQNCTKANAGKCFDPSVDEENTASLSLNPADVQKTLDMMESGIPLDYNKHVEGFVNLYAVRKKQLTERILALSEYYFPKFEEILDREGLPQEFKYLAVVESALNPQAQSWAGACGLWQFIHSTGLAYGLKINGMVDERRDPEKATLAACQYFKNSYELYGDWLLVIASYNCGPGNVNKAIRKSGGKRSFWEVMKYLPKETRGYVPAFIAVAYVMNNAEQLGLKPAEFDIHELVENVEVDQWVHFGQMSKVLGIPMEDLEYLNPEYRKKIIPASTSSKHTITLPYKYAMRFAELKDSVYATPFSDYSKEEEAEYLSKRVVHKVRKGETLVKIAKKYGVKTSDLKAWNIIKGNSVKPGKKLVVYQKVKVKPNSKPSKEDEEVETEEEEVKMAAKDKPAPIVVVVDSAKTAAADSAAQAAKTQTPKQKPTTTVNTMRYHKVERGDTLYSISKQYGLTVEKLRVYNQLPKNAVIKPGTKLKITPGS
ncbi:MAG: transglycosylase SLT domain-containing protein [Bacteroidetes bacterium]|nr:MAG: transglycosylase SLT domain-containing protein [Bacteroidota bacterium]